jgi:acyl-CoA thioesterase-1
MRNRRVLPLHHALLRPLLLVLLCLLSWQSLQAQTDKPVILVFGDSLSAGYRMDESDGWVALLAERLEAQNSPFAVVNASVSGETTDGGLARLPAALSTHMPAVVILELGGNDGLRGLPVANIRRNLEEMVMMSQAAGAQVILAGMQIPPNYGPRYTGPFTALFGEIAAERNLHLIPFLIDGIPQQPELMQDDGIHPRAEAQPLIVDIVWPVLEPVLQALQPSS